MSTAVFPSLPGQGWSLVRKPTYKTRKQEAISGAETALADRIYPRYEWEITFELLRQGNVGDPGGRPWSEFAQLFGFYNARRGGFDSFLFQDNLDNTATNQAIATGDGSTTSFQLVRTFGGNIEPVFAPNIVTGLKVNGVLKTAGVDYVITLWPDILHGGPGRVNFLTGAPAAGLPITIDTFVYSWPVRF